MAETSVKVTRGEYLDRAKIPARAEERVQSKTDRKPSYTETLHARLNKSLLPRFGSQQLDQVSVSGIENLRDEMRQLGRSSVTINGVIRMIGGVFKMGSAGASHNPQRLLALVPRHPDHGNGQRRARNPFPVSGKSGYSPEAAAARKKNPLSSPVAENAC